MNWKNWINAKLPFVGTKPDIAHMQRVLHCHAYAYGLSSSSSGWNSFRKLCTDVASHLNIKITISIFDFAQKTRQKYSWLRLWLFLDALIYFVLQFWLRLVFQVIFSNFITLVYKFKRKQDGQILDDCH